MSTYKLSLRAAPNLQLSPKKPECCQTADLKVGAWCSINKSFSSPMGIFVAEIFFNFRIKTEKQVHQRLAERLTARRILRNAGLQPAVHIYVWKAELTFNPLHIACRPIHKFQLRIYVFRIVDIHTLDAMCRPDCHPQAVAVFFILGLACTNTSIIFRKVTVLTGSNMSILA